MDAKKFFEEARRMCKKQDKCKGCPIKSEGTACLLGSIPILVYDTKDIDKAIEAAEKWSQDHPRKTRLMDFLEKYPNAPMGKDGAPNLLPWSLGYCGNTPCYACEKAEGKPWAWCWGQEV